MAGAGSAKNLMNAQHAVALACLKGLEHASTMGMQRVILETDASDVANAISRDYLDRSVLNTLFREIRVNLLYDFTRLYLSVFKRL